MTPGSTIRVGYNTYSVPSRLIGEKLDVTITPEVLEVRLGTVLVEQLPRLRGRHKHRIQYRHVIDWLVRKPGAFASYRYRDEMFPTSRFRRAYDVLVEHNPARASKDYLRILELAAKETETGVDEVLGRLLDQRAPITPTAIAEQLLRDRGMPLVTQVKIAAIDLSLYDSFLEGKEVMVLQTQQTSVRV